MMAALFPENLVQQEMSTERWIEIPEPVREIYALWRPTPLLRAVRLEKALQTPAHIDWTQCYQPRMEERARLGMQPDAHMNSKNPEQKNIFVHEVRKTGRTS